MELLLIVYFIANIYAFLLYRWDKMQAQIQAQRIPEKKLLWWAFFAPFGAYFGMIIFRHKVRKAKFTTLVPLFILLHLLFFTAS